jgi:hypothetical protein
MPDESESERQWVVEPPPGQGEISLYMACGEGVELTAEQESALSALLLTLEDSDAEVVGHSKNCPELSICNPLSCGKVGCWPGLQCNTLTRSAAVSASQGWSLLGSFGSPP